MPNFKLHGAKLLDSSVPGFVEKPNQARPTFDSIRILSALSKQFQSPRLAGGRPDLGQWVERRYAPIHGLRRRSFGLDCPALRALLLRCVYHCRPGLGLSGKKSRQNITKS